jgi:hypothetical protein
MRSKSVGLRGTSVRGSFSGNLIRGELLAPSRTRGRNVSHIVKPLSVSGRSFAALLRSSSNSASDDGRTLKQDRIVAATIKMLFTARCLPGQVLIHTKTTRCQHSALFGETEPSISPSAKPKHCQVCVLLDGYDAAVIT